MMTIPGHCTTNLDEYKRERWPRRFAVVPSKGDRVESDARRSLCVHGITHAERDGAPYIIVELHR